MESCERRSQFVVAWSAPRGLTDHANGAHVLPLAGARLDEKLCYGRDLV